jgi:hypothetical protein
VVLKKISLTFNAVRKNFFKTITMGVLQKGLGEGSSPNTTKTSGDFKEQGEWVRG